MVMEDKSEYSQMTMTCELTDINLKADIKPDRFVFKAPEGVEVRDMTGTSASAPAGERRKP